MKNILKTLVVLLVAGFLTACSTQKIDEKVIRVGATPAPHAQILEVIKPLVEAKGYTLEIVEFTDYILPNKALDTKELDANYFQHVPYLTSFNEKNKTDLTSVLKVHFEPLGLYPGKTASLAALQKGATIAVPNDDTNEARALALLEANGLIKINPSKVASATVLDIVENKLDLKFVELEAAQLARSLGDVDLAVINGNYALEAKIDSTVLLTEDKDSAAADTYANVLVVRTGDEETAKTKVLIEALSSQEVADYIEANYYPTVIPAF